MNFSITTIRKKETLEEIKLRRFQNKNRDIVINKQDLDENFLSFSNESDGGSVNEDEEFNLRDNKGDSSDEDYVSSNDNDSLGKSKDKQHKNLIKIDLILHPILYLLLMRTKRKRRKKLFIPKMKSNECDSPVIYREILRNPNFSQENRRMLCQDKHTQ